MDWSAIQRRRVFLCWTLCALLAGCSSWRIPRIDPSGQSIFLPNESTSLVAPRSPIGCVPGTPTPAYQTPPAIPPCPDPYAPQVAPAIPALPAYPSTVPPIVAPATAGLVLSPGRVVAPVGSEVVLHAGVPDGQRRATCHDKIEWFLSQESVGHFVAVDEEGQYRLFHLLGHGPRKVSSNYVVGRPARAARVITRGTPGREDDVVLKRGESWVSVSSVSEGTSRISAVVPDMEAWQNRKQTATIHWIDAQWQFPTPQIGRAGTPLRMSTTVTRHTNGAPVAGWVVRYEFASGPAIGFGPERAGAAEVVTDAQGNAAIDVLPQSNAPGITQIRIQIVRIDADGSRLVVGQGATSVTWSAPALSIRIVGPETADREATIPYRIEVSNPGDLTASDVIVTDRLPDNLRYINSTPVGEEFGNQLQWRLGELPGRSSRTIQLNCTAKRAGDLQHCVNARAADGLTAEHCTGTRITAQSLKVDMTGPERAVDVGGEAQFRITVTNIGDQPLTNVVLTDRFDPALQLAQDAAPSPIQRQLEDLEPGQSRRIAISFIATAPGQHCHSLDVTADGGHRIALRGCLTAIQPIQRERAKVQLQLTAPQSRQVGEIAEFNAAIINQGNVAITNVRVVFSARGNLQFDRATPGFTPDQQQKQLIWSVARIEPGRTAQFQINCKCAAADDNAIGHVAISGNPDVVEATESRLVIVARPQGDAIGIPSDDSGDIRPIDEGQLRVTVSDLADPIRIDGTTTYLINVINNRTLPDKRVTLTVVAPVGLRLDSVTGPVRTENVSPDGQSIRMEPIAELRPGETVTFRAKVTALRTGKLVVQTKVESLRSAEPIVVNEDTTVFVE